MTPDTLRAWELLTPPEIELMLALFPPPQLPRGASVSLRVRFANGLRANRALIEPRRAA